MTEPADRLYEEVSFLAFHLHWALDDLMDMEHPLRRRFVDEVSSINRRINGE